MGPLIVTAGCGVGVPEGVIEGVTDGVPVVVSVVVPRLLVVPILRSISTVPLIAHPKELKAEHREFRLQLIQIEEVSDFRWQNAVEMLKDIRKQFWGMR